MTDYEEVEARLAARAASSGEDPRELARRLVGDQAAAAEVFPEPRLRFALAALCGSGLLSRAGLPIETGDATA